MTDREDIQKAKRGRWFSLLGSGREIRRLNLYLHEGERVDDFVAGVFGDFQYGRALLVATNERLIAIKDGWIFRSSQDMSYADITTVEVNTGLLYSKLEIHGEGMQYTVTKVFRWGGDHLVKLVRERIGVRHQAWLRREREEASALRAHEAAAQHANNEVPLNSQPFAQSQVSAEAMETVTTVIPTPQQLFEQGMISREQLDRITGAPVAQPSTPRADRIQLGRRRESD